MSPEIRKDTFSDHEWLAVVTYFYILYFRCIRILGKQENIRVMQLALFQGVAKKHRAAITIEMKASENPVLQNIQADPTIICTAFKKNRFYMVRTFSILNNDILAFMFLLVFFSLYFTSAFCLGVLENTNFQEELLCILSIIQQF